MNNNTIKDLGDGLVLRRGIEKDTERIADYNAHHLSDDGPEEPVEMLRHWTKDMMTRHPTMTPGDFTYVEDTKTKQVVSSTCLISQTWAYEGIPFGVGRVEVVSTHREYRRRGLVRAQLETLHRWSVERGEKMQSITGIPYYYRQFGYEMTVNLGGGRKGYLPHIPKLKEDETEPFQIRQATVADIPLLQELYRYACKRSLLSTLRDEAMWRYELADQHDEYRGIIAIIESLEGEAVGFIWHGNNLWGSGLGLFAYELKPGASWVGVTPTVIRYLAKKGEEYAEKDDKKDFHSYNFNLVSDHPALAISEKYLPEIDHPYAWYIRIPDIPGFLSHISPVLEKRLEDSDLAGYSGELLLDFHRSGVKMVFENGKLTASEPWQPSTEDRGDLAFPDLAFLHLLFGYKAFTELESMFVDCYRREKPESPFLADILFPKKPSHLNAIM